MSHFICWSRLAWPAALALVLSVPSTAAACPFCKEALGSSGGDLVNGFFYSILFMLSMPFLIASTFGGCMYLAVRRARQKAEADKSEDKTDDEKFVG